MLSAPQPHSIWLCPERKMLDALGAQIDALTRLSGTPRFKPHLTLLGDLSDAPQKTIDSCRSNTAGLGGLRVRVSAVEQSDDFFMSLFLDIEPTESLSALRSAIGQDLSCVNKTCFRPHISLAYGLAPSRLDASGLIEIRHRFVKRTFVLSSLLVMSSAKVIAIEEWAELYHLTL